MELEMECATCRVDLPEGERFRQVCGKAKSRQFVPVVWGRGAGPQKHRCPGLAGEGGPDRGS